MALHQSWPFFVARAGIISMRHIICSRMRNILIMYNVVLPKME